VGRAKRRRIEFQSGQEHKWQTCDSSYEPLWLSLLRFLLHTMNVVVVVPLCGLCSLLSGLPFIVLVAENHHQFGTLLNALLRSFVSNAQACIFYLYLAPV
jgi:hypothetical protein